MSKPRSWEELVEAGLRAVSTKTAAFWVLGDLALEVEPLTGRGSRSQAKAHIRKYANELGMGFTTLWNYRWVASAWPPDKRLDVSYWIHRELASHPDRFRILRRLDAQAQRERRRVRLADVVAATGKGKPRTVAVRDHERRLPGTVDSHENVTSITKARKPAEWRQILEPLTTAQIGALIDEAWAVLEERSKKKVAA